jgi:hypothetical protein
MQCVTLRNRDDEVHPGAGNPRLVRSGDGHALAGTPEAEGIQPSHQLGIDVTTVGSDDDQDIRLEGIEPAHGEIRREASDDEFVYHHVSGAGASRINGAIVTSAGLHHGDRLTVGSWTLVYQRDEYADHGRYDGGREGGQSSGPVAAGFGGHEDEASESRPAQ